MDTGNPHSAIFAAWTSRQSLEIIVRTRSFIVVIVAIANTVLLSHVDNPVKKIPENIRSVSGNFISNDSQLDAPPVICGPQFLGQLVTRFLNCSF